MPFCYGRAVYRLYMISDYFRIHTTTSATINPPTLAYFKMENTQKISILTDLVDFLFIHEYINHAGFAGFFQRNSKTEETPKSNFFNSFLNN